MGRILALIPAFNEEATIGSVIIGAREHVDQVVVVDDGSTDETASIAEAAGATVIRRTTNGGKGLALADGLKSGLGTAAEIVVTLDADYQHAPQEIPSLLAPLKQGMADVVIGSRRMDSSARSQIPRHRRWVQAFFSRASGGKAGNGASDAVSGFRAYRGQSLAGIKISEAGYGVDLEILSQLRERDARVVEVPISVRYGVPFPSKRPPHVQGYDILRGVIRFVRLERPLLFFGSFGGALLAIGLYLGTTTALAYYADGEFWAGRAMVTMLCVILGTVLFVVGLILDTLKLAIRRYGSTR